MFSKQINVLHITCTSVKFSIFIKALFYLDVRKILLLYSCPR